MDANDLKKWAAREIELAAKEIAMNSESEEHLDECYDAAYCAFCDFIDKMERVNNPGIVKTVFLQLFNEFPLTPIEDNDNDWEFIDNFDQGEVNGSIYVCKRRPYLFKKVTCENGSVTGVKYTDQNRAYCIDVNTNLHYRTAFLISILDEMMPIEMPYFPTGEIKIFTEDFNTVNNHDKGIDTIGVFYLRLPDGQMKEVKRFFKLDVNTKEPIEISCAEYLYRKKKSKELKKVEE